VETATLIDGFDSYVYQVIEEISNIEYEKKYSVLYLDNYLDVCVCDLQKGEFDRFPMDKKQRDKISEKTEKNVMMDCR
jgi:hypothetical protein